MKRWCVIVGCAFLMGPIKASATTSYSDTLSHWKAILKMEQNYFDLQRSYDLQWERLNQELLVINETFSESLLAGDLLESQKLWQERWELERRLSFLEKQEEIDLLKVRYRNGIELIKLLYEKMLSLDHHFSGMEIYQNVMLLSNPNTYPEFKAIRKVLEEKLKKKHSISLPPSINANPYLSATFSIVAAFIGEGDAKAKQAELDEIACVLDLTVQMTGELNIIKYETGFLQMSNLQLKGELESLFTDYCKIIRYLVPLDRCRKEDDWEQLYLHLDKTVEKLKEELAGAQHAGLGGRNMTRTLINLEFATRQVAEFVAKYSQFIVQGRQYYQKFLEIVEQYEAKETCQGTLPMPYDKLKRDITHTIDKFQETYILPELEGSRLKELLYGYPEATR